MDPGTASLIVGGVSAVTNIVGGILAATKQKKKTKGGKKQPAVSSRLVTEQLQLLTDIQKEGIKLTKIIITTTERFNTTLLLKTGRTTKASRIISTSKL